MQVKSVQKIFLIFGCILSFAFVNKNVWAQKIKYCSENVFIDFADHLQIVSNISGNHHLLNFIYNEKPVIFVFDRDLQLQSKVRIPYKFPEKSEVRIIPFDNYYYLFIHPPNSLKYSFWKIDGNGNFKDLSDAFQKLIQPQSHYTRLGFQLVVNQKEFAVVYHTYVPNIQKNVIIILQTDSLLKVVSTKRALYDFKRDEEKLQQEFLLNGKFLLVLKTAKGGTSLQLMKVNLANGITISNTFYSSGYYYTQPAFNVSDSAITIYSLLREPGISSKLQRYIFIGSLDSLLAEKAPFKVLKSQFLKGTFINFLLTADLSHWINLQRDKTFYSIYEANATPFQDFTNTDPDNINRAFSLLQKVNPNSVRYFSDDQSQGVRFSLLDKNLKLSSDSLVPNNRNSYTIQPDQFTHFNAGEKDYLLLSQHFYRRKNGLLMVNSEEKKLVYTDVRVNDRYEYLLPLSRPTSQGVIVPYIYRRGAGLIRITIE